MSTTKTKSKATDRTHHTPGPWRFNLQPNPSHPTVIATCPNAENELYRGINGPRHVRRGEMEFNARLITVAPDLLQFVRAFLDTRPLSHDEMVTKYGYSADGMREIAHGLIAKADNA